MSDTPTASSVGEAKSDTRSGRGDVVLADESLDAGHRDHAETRQVVVARGGFNTEGSGDDGDQCDEAEARQCTRHARAVAGGLEVTTLTDQEDKDRRGDD